MASHIAQSNNWSIQAVPLAFALGLLPQVFYTVRLVQETKGQLSNAT